MRLNLFEFEDQPWLPSAIRDGQTDYFSFAAGLNNGPYVEFSKKLAAAFAHTNDDTLVELGAGGGGHSIAITRNLLNLRKVPLKLTLTDLYPNITRLRYVENTVQDFEVEIISSSVDAANVPESVKGFRLFCNAFHHLPPELATACLADAVSKKSGIAILELVGRNPYGFFNVIVGTLAMLVMMPFVRPFRVDRIFFTYFVPLIPLTTLWDGFASCFRVYSPNELQSMVNAVAAPDYNWEMGYIKVPRLPIKLTFLIGYNGKSTVL